MGKTEYKIISKEKAEKVVNVEHWDDLIERFDTDRGIYEDIEDADWVVYDGHSRLITIEKWSAVEVWTYAYFVNTGYENLDGKKVSNRNRRRKVYQTGKGHYYNERHRRVYLPNFKNN